MKNKNPYWLTRRIKSLEEEVRSLRVKLKRVNGKKRYPKKYES